MYKHFKHCLIIISVTISWWFPGWHHFIPRSWQLGSGVIHGRCTSLIYQKLIKNKYDQICSIACMYMQWSLVCNKFGRRGIFQNKANDYYDWFLCRFRNAEKFDRLLRNEVPPVWRGYTCQNFVQKSREIGKYLKYLYLRIKWCK